MFTEIEIFRMASGLARHASARQTVVAANIANANTPGYRAKDIPSFAESLRRPSTSQPLHTTRPEHRSGTNAVFRSAAREVSDTTAGPDGNTVSIETEIMKSAELRQQHDMALTIYRSALGIVRGSLGSR